MSPWKELIETKNITLLGLSETLEGGQSFNWNSTSENSWIGSFNSKVVELKFSEDVIFWRTSLSHQAKEEDVLNYLWFDRTYPDCTYLSLRTDCWLFSPRDRTNMQACESEVAYLRCGWERSCCCLKLHLLRAHCTRWRSASVYFL